MKALLAFILMSGVYAKSLRLPIQPNAIPSEDLADSQFEDSVLVHRQQHPQQILDENDYRDYILDRKIYAKLQRHAMANQEDSEIQKTVNFLIKTMRQRGKRSYQPCYFKMCILTPGINKTRPSARSWRILRKPHLSDRMPLQITDYNGIVQN